MSVTAVGLVYKNRQTGSSNTNVTVPATGYYTGSTLNIMNYPYFCVAGALWSGSATLTGANTTTVGTIYLSYSFDGSIWNNFDTYTGSIKNTYTVYSTDKSAAGVIVNMPIYPSFVRGLLYNASGSALSGSVWVTAWGA